MPSYSIRSTRSDPSVPTPMLDRLTSDGWSSVPLRRTMPLGSPLAEKKSPLTPATVADADARRSMAVRPSRPTTVLFESAAVSP